jgi:23S rRNA U2552 (ribose-2'-O)-methylase RlmE/FtsJ
MDELDAKSDVLGFKKDPQKNESLGGSEAVAKASNAGESTKETRRSFDLDIEVSHRETSKQPPRRESLWDMYKKYTNPYEYIHTMIPQRKHSVCKLRPLSRAFYKMVEILHQFPQLIVPVRSVTVPSMTVPPVTHLRSFHLAEGPGGFIEAVAKMRGGSVDATRDVYVGMTLMDPSNQTYSIPAWKKSETFLRDHPQVQIEKGADGTGDLLVADNFKYLYETYGGSMDLVTGDGGFDFSTDFDHQEINILPLLYAQIACGTCMLKKGGSLVLKIFDLFTTPTLDLLALLSSLYDHVSIVKPVTSRYANSEKYVVCTGFRMDTHELPALFDVLYRNFTPICPVKEIPLCDSSSVDKVVVPSETMISASYFYYDPRLGWAHNNTVVLPSSPPEAYTSFPASSPKSTKGTGLRPPSLAPLGSYPKYMHRMLAVNMVPCTFIHAVSEYNTIMVQQQIENIHFTMNLIREHEKEYILPGRVSDLVCSQRSVGMTTATVVRREVGMTRKIQMMLRNHMQKCVQWCIKHRMPYHNLP